MKTPEQYEAEIADLKAMIDRLKQELTKALDKVVELSIP